MDKKPVEIEILGKKYFIRSDSKEKLDRYVEYLQNQLTELNDKFNTVDQLKLFLLYSLNITEKFFIEKDKCENLSKEIEKLKEILDRELEEEK